MATKTTSKEAKPKTIKKTKKTKKTDRAEKGKNYVCEICGCEMSCVESSNEMIMCCDEPMSLVC